MTILTRTTCADGAALDEAGAAAHVAGAERAAAEALGAALVDADAVARAGTTRVERSEAAAA